MVGTGPGSLDYLTPAARSIIETCDVVLGYNTYLELIEPILQGKTVISSAMMQEVERVRKALEIAESGKKVCLVSGGDPGIYAMAGLVFDVAKSLNSSVQIEVVAGIAALNSCAERLGAPLMHDFAVISLSDLLTPWEVIEKRLEAAASADFVMVIYNPRSKKRTWQLQSAVTLIRRFRTGETPVGIVKSATRKDEEIIIATLDTFEPTVVTMQSTVIFGNSKSYIWNNRMVTPRGYLDKYHL
ncbi:MAG: precorrin-3B C(17)-methyltransferase [Desulfocapsaceae bacterium]|nr:precorrin-3B C(17)-methyltransferase [Desulfocapsaceae bacterium]